VAEHRRRPGRGGDGGEVGAFVVDAVVFALGPLPGLARRSMT